MEKDIKPANNTDQDYFEIIESKDRDKLESNGDASDEGYLLPSNNKVSDDGYLFPANQIIRSSEALISSTKPMPRGRSPRPSVPPRPKKPPGSPMRKENS